MQALKKVSVNGWDLEVLDEHDARVRDVDIAARAGMTRPRNVRQVIERNREELQMHGVLEVRCSEQQTSGGRPGLEYWLNEGQSLALVALLRTEAAARIRFELIRAYCELRERLDRGALCKR